MCLVVKQVIKEAALIMAATQILMGHFIQLGKFISKIDYKLHIEQVK